MTVSHEACTATSSVDLTITKVPASDDGTATTEHTVLLCQGDIAQLNGYYENGITGTWTGDGIADKSNPATTVTVPADGAAHIYTWKYQKAGCGVDISETWSVTNSSAKTPTTATEFAICDNTTSVNLGNANGGEWTKVSGGNAVSIGSTDGIAKGMTDVGAYKFRWTGEACGADVTKDVTIYKFKAGATATPATVCGESDNISLTGSGFVEGAGTSYVEWTATNGTVEVASSSSTIGHAYPGSANFKYTIHTVIDGVAGCTSYKEVAVTNNGPTLELSTTNADNCGSATIVASASNYTSLSWKVDNDAPAANSVSGTTLTLGNLSAGMHTIECTATKDECTVTKSVSVNNSTFSLKSTATKIPLCASDRNSVTVTATPVAGADCEWTIDGAGSISDPHSPNITVGGLQENAKTTLTWNVNKPGCPTQKEVYEIYNMGITAVSDVDRLVCDMAGKNVTVGVTFPYAVETPEIEWTAITTGASIVSSTGVATLASDSKENTFNILQPHWRILAKPCSPSAPTRVR